MAGVAAAGRSGWAGLAGAAAAARFGWTGLAGAAAWFVPRFVPWAKAGVIRAVPRAAISERREKWRIVSSFGFDAGRRMRGAYDGREVAAGYLRGDGGAAGAMAAEPRRRPIGAPI
jgi:hypothetical protein